VWSRVWRGDRRGDLALASPLQSQRCRLSAGHGFDNRAMSVQSEPVEGRDQQVGFAL
ncbi:nitrite reductase small subunit, partial [Aeromonas hydrophila]